MLLHTRDVSHQILFMNYFYYASDIEFRAKKPLLRKLARLVLRRASPLARQRPRRQHLRFLAQPPQQRLHQNRCLAVCHNPAQQLHCLAPQLLHLVDSLVLKPRLQLHLEVFLVDLQVEGCFLNQQPQALGAQAERGLLGSKPMTGGLFGSAAAAQPAMETKQTVQGILQESDALVRSLTKVELFGDERDEMIAKLNQLAAAMGVGAGYYKDGQQPVQYTQSGPFHRIKAIGYNRTSQHSDSDGIVALVVKAPVTEYQTSEQKQKFVDALFVVLGSKPTIHAHIESVTALPDNFTEICIYVTEKFRGRISSKELAQYLNQAAQKQQLETQLKVDKDKIVSRVQMDKQQKELYLRDPPT
ncbi:hypothetical protein OSTOST_19028, partial [Ostertagia ostertagi]